MTGWIDGSWHRLRDWAGREANAIRAEARLFMTRADCLQLAIERSEGIAAGQIVSDFRELDLREVVNDIIAVLRQCLVVMITSTGGGALLGGIAGGIGGAGVGAIPGAALGAAAGTQVGEWLLMLMGLKVLAEYIVRDMPTIAHRYSAGLRQAWLAASPAPLPQQQVRIDAFALQNAATTLARGHVAMVVLLLMGIVAYLAKGRGNIGELADNVGNSKLGGRFAEWMVRNEGKLKAEPRLRPREPVTPKDDATVASKSSRTPAVSQRRATTGTTKDMPSDSPEKAKIATESGKFGNIPASITTSSGIVIRPTDGRTTTILGSFSSDLDTIVNGKLAYPKTTNFGSKPGGYNVLNVPDAMFTSRTPEQFWVDVNRPFLDAAMLRGDPIYVATRPSADLLQKADGTITGFGREMKYLASNGYTYSPATGLMTKP